jgi:hypothetical protein
MKKIYLLLLLLCSIANAQINLGYQGYIVPFAYCSTNPNAGHTFILSEHIPFILGDLPPAEYTVSFYNTLFEAQYGIQALPNQYTTTYASQSLFVRVVENADTSNFGIGIFNLEVWTQPTATAVVLFTKCDDTAPNDDTTTFDLTSKEGEISSCTDCNFIYYSDASHTNLISNPESYQNVENSQFVFVEIYSPSGCGASSTITLTVLPMPGTSPTPFTLCEENGIPGTGTFDLTTKDLEITGGSPSFTVEYNDGNMPIANPQAYENTSNPQTIYAVVTSPWGCTNTLPLALQVNEAPQAEVSITNQNITVITTSVGECTFALDEGDYQTSNYFANVSIGSHNLIIKNSCGIVSILTFTVAPNAPTGEINQDFTEGETLADLEVTGENIVWYATDGQTPPPSALEETPLPLTTVLIDGTTYYATQTIDDTESTDRLAVTVHSVLSTDKNTIAGFSLYPNPVKDVVKLSAQQPLGQVTLYTIVGQPVFSKNFTDTAATIDMAPFAKGIYLLKIQSANGQKTVKIIKE